MVFIGKWYIVGWYGELRMVEISGEDLGSLGVVAERPSVVKALRDHHYRVARLIAEGKRTGEVAAEVGMAVSRVSVLKGDPAFRALVEAYRERLDGIADEAFADVRRKAELLRANALDVMNERYEEDPNSITHSMARDDLAISNAMLDNKPVVSLHGHLRDLPLAEVVNLRRARAEGLEASQKILPVGEATTEPGSESHASGVIPAPTKQIDGP